MIGGQLLSHVTHVETELNRAELLGNRAGIRSDSNSCVLSHDVILPSWRKRS